MDDNMNPATTVDPQAASQQGTLDSFSSTPRYVRLPHVVHDSRGGRGLPFVCVLPLPGGILQQLTTDHTPSVTTAGYAAQSTAHGAGHYLPATPRLPISTRTRKDAVAAVRPPVLATPLGGRSLA